MNLDNEILEIRNEIIFLNNYKKKLKLFFYSQTLSGNVIRLDFDRFIDEIERITLEIKDLENQKNRLIKTKEKL
jgi:hypothetical protein